MYKTLAVAAITCMLGGASLGIPRTANADSIILAGDDVAIGYSDGYWDREHRWHAWEHAEQREAYRREKNAEYHEWKHDRDKDMGWHERHFQK